MGKQPGLLNLAKTDTVDAMKKSIRVLVVGCGNMGASHAKAYQSQAGFELVGLVSRKPESRTRVSEALGGVPTFDDYPDALDQTNPDAVSINTYPDTHAAYALIALASGRHVFIEKPIAETVADAQKVVAAAHTNHRKLVVGYILRHHPSWRRFVEIAQGLGKPLVMRMNLNQQSHGETWTTHRNLMNSISPIVDCGVHYVDVMCQMTGSQPVRVSAISARLTDDLTPGMYNYGQLQIAFEDGSVGWYEAGWGPMMSETAFFVKDVVGPKGSVSIVAKEAGGDAQSDNVDAYTKTESLKVHHAELDVHQAFAKPDEFIDLTDEPDHDELCAREQAFFLRAIQEDLDLTDHMNDAVNSLSIVLAADESARTGKTVNL